MSHLSDVLKDLDKYDLADVALDAFHDNKTLFESFITEIPLLETNSNDLFNSSIKLPWHLIDEEPERLEKVKSIPKFYQFAESKGESEPLSIAIRCGFMPVFEIDETKEFVFKEINESIVELTCSLKQSQRNMIVYRSQVEGLIYNTISTSQLIDCMDPSCEFARCVTRLFSYNELKFLSNLSFPNADKVDVIDDIDKVSLIVTENHFY